MSETSEEVQLVYRRLGDLARWPRNPKAHDLEKIKESFRRFGFVLPLVEDASTGQLVAGHGRLEALLGMQQDREPAPGRIEVDEVGHWLVPVVVGQAFASEDEAEAYLLADNRLVEAGGWDYTKLVDMLKGFEDLTGTGWTAPDVTDLVEDTTTERVQGRTPEKLIEGFKTATVKQVVLYFGAPEYELTLARILAAQTALGVDGPAELLEKLLEDYA